MELDTFSILAALLIGVSSVLSQDRPPFISIKAPRETISNYEVHTPVVSGAKGLIGEYHESLDIGISTHRIHLELNHGLVHPHFTSRYFDDRGEEVVKKGHVNCFYHGTVEGHPDWHVAMSTCNGLQGSFGELGIEDNYYHIEPLDPTNSTLEQPHAFFKSNEYSAEKGSCGVRSHTIHRASHLPQNVHIDKNRVRRQINGFYIVEWVLINDFAQFESLGRNITATVLRDLEIANLVDSLYRTLMVRVVVVDVITWSMGDQITYPSNNNPDPILDELVLYAPQVGGVHDSIMLITGVDLQGSTVGLAFVGTMCGSRSLGLSQDGLRPLANVGSTTAHELGHIFSMDHDDDPSCGCTDPSGRCIMASVSGFPSPVEWSRCSRDDITEGLSVENLQRCLGNEPLNTVADPVCGNGIKEEEEMCDCGSPQECVDPCCNATTCMLREGAQCFSQGDCCTQDCQFIPFGTPCRAAAQECDIMEFCTGDSSECPIDIYLQDGQPCNNDLDFCFSGECQVLDATCQRFFSSENGNPQCYSELNVVGDGRGNCGSRDGQHVACAPEHAQCGQLQCASGSFSGGLGGVTVFSRSFRNDAGQVVTCISFTSAADADMVSPGLVPDGARCGNESLCLSQQCVPIASLDFLESCPVGGNGLTCSGAGLCNNLNQCSCNNNSAGGIACDGHGPAGDNSLGDNSAGENSSGDNSAGENSSGDNSAGDNTGAIVGAVFGVLLAIALAVGISVALFFLVRYLMLRQQKSILPTVRRPPPSKTVTRFKQDDSITTVEVVKSSGPPPKHKPPSHQTSSSSTKVQPSPPKPPPPSAVAKQNGIAPTPAKRTVAPSSAASNKRTVAPSPAASNKRTIAPSPPAFNKRTVAPPPTASNKRTVAPSPAASNKRTVAPPPAASNKKTVAPSPARPPPPSPQAAPTAKPGKIQGQWPPPNSAEPQQKKPLAPPKKPVFPPRK